MRTIIAVLAGWLLAVTPAFAEDIGKRTEHLSADVDGNTVHYYVCLPPNFDAKKTYALVVNVPGMGAEKGEAANNQSSRYARRFSFMPGFQDEHIGMGIWYSGPLARHWANPKAFAATMKTIDIVREKYPIDPKRIYLLGFSCGSTFLLDLVWGDNYPQDKFPFAGVIICSNATAATHKADIVKSKSVPKELPIFVECGSKEQDVVRASEKIVAQFKKAGHANVDFHIIKGQGHAISDSDSGLPVNAVDLIVKWIQGVNGKLEK